MNLLRKLGVGSMELAACLFLAGTAYADCTGPQALMAKLRSQHSTEAALQLGNWFAGNKQFDCAAQTFREALKTDPQSAQLHYLAGLALAGAGHSDEAVPAVMEAIRLQPDAIKPHLLLATIYSQSGHSSQSEEQFRKALAIDPHSEIALEGLSGVLLSRKDYIDVVSVLTNAPRTEALTLRLAEALEALNSFDVAEGALLEAMKLSPNSLPLAHAESSILVEKESYLEAVKLWRYMVARHPGDREAELQYLRILVLTEHTTLARPLGLKLLAEEPHDWQVLYLNGILDRATGDLATSKVHLSESVAIKPDFFASRFHLGMTLIALHEWKEGKENLEKALELGYTDMKVHFELSVALHALGETDAAEKELQTYQEMRKAGEANLEAAPDARQADGELANGKVQEAIKDYRQACDKAPGNAGNRYKLAMALHKAGEFDEERTQLEEAVKINPSLGAAQKELGYMLAKSGDAAGAVEHFGKAVEAEPVWVDAWINLSAELAVEARFPEARKAVEMALRLDPSNAQARKLSDRLANDPASQQTHP
jgi:tetratricopeptide (TPR) repeat protein